MVYFLIMIFISVVIEVMVAAVLIRLFALGNKFFITVTVMNLITSSVYGFLNYYYGSVLLVIVGIVVIFLIESTVIYVFHRKTIGVRRAALISVILNAAGTMGVVMVSLVLGFFTKFFAPDLI